MNFNPYRDEEFTPDERARFEANRRADSDRHFALEHFGRLRLWTQYNVLRSCDAASFDPAFCIRAFEVAAREGRVDRFTTAEIVEIFNEVFPLNGYVERLQNLRRMGLF